ncbi:MAG TPA: ATP-binding protein [Verrucomicrobiae bacterium]|nr:ATP-binding protein [Verrucomicrobiae bacterium]
MTVNLLTSGAVLLLTCLAFFAYEVLTFRQATVEKLSTLGKIIAANSTASLAFDNSSDANETLAALKAEPHIVAAGLYDANGKLFSQYPENSPASAFPAAPGKDGYHFEQGHLAGFQPVMQDNKRLGTLYINSDMEAMYEQLWRRGEIAALVMVISLLMAYLLSRALQKQISQPIMSLAETANAVSKRRDFSVRAVKFGNDELGLLTDAFNQMLAGIQARDSALHEAQALYHSLVEQMPAGIFRKDAEGRYVFVNSWFCRLSGMKPEHYLGKTPQEFMHEMAEQSLTTLDAKNTMDLAAISDRHHATIMQTGERIELEEERILASGKKQYLHVVKAPVFNSDGKIVGTQGTLIDITERKRAEEEVHQLNVELEQRVVKRTAELETANKELEAFSYSVSHDLRAPLRHVDGFVDLLRKQAAEKLDDRGRRYLDVIAASARQMGTLIDDLLVFSRMSRGDLRRAKVASESLVHEVRDALQGEIRGRVVWKVDSLPQVEADAAMLRQVWANLIGNAIKYSRTRDPAEIEIGCNTVNDEFVFFVRDNGVGFDMQYVDKLFGVFQRLHRADEFEGTGIGLANVRRIVSRHGGRTWAESKVGSGATFFFSLPKTSTETKG